MRTTLKRGIGRGAPPLNGNGRAAAPSGTRTPMRVYRQPGTERSRTQWLFRRVALAFGALLVMLVAGALGGAYLQAQEFVEEVTDAPPEVVKAQKHLSQEVPPASQPANALVIGYDKRAGVESGFEARSDTVMLVRADPHMNAVSMLSFPRDLVVDIPCRGQTYRQSLNAAYTLCGPQGTLRAVQSLTDLPIHYLITVNFRGFKQVVARLGGVWIDVDRRYFNDNSGYGPRYATIDLRPGYQKLNGSEALDFVRYRHTDSDLYRHARQQMFLRAFNQQISTSFSAKNVLKTVGTVAQNVDIAQGGNNKPSLKTLWSYALFAYKLPPGHFFQSKIEGVTEITQGAAPLWAPPESINLAVREFLNPDVDAPVKATAAALRERLRASAPPPRNTPVTVLNGNGRTGAASTAGWLLNQRGYPIVPPPDQLPADAPSYNYFPTKVYYRPAQPAARAAAVKVKNLFGSAEVEPLPAGKVARLGRNAMLTVVVGETFQGTLASAPVDKTPERQPPSVYTNPDATREYLREAARQVRFPLQIPTVLERSSTPDYDGQPLHVYEFAGGRKTVRLTFRTGASEYWGIQQTDWKDAPALAKPSRSRKLGGRWYDLYYSGPHLQMVVLRDRGVTYWVVNTLLNTLSNETMLAIARGLRPFRG